METGRGVSLLSLPVPGSRHYLQHMEIVVWISLGIAVVSALFAGLAWKETKRMADSAEEGLGIERARDKRAEDEKLSAHVSVSVAWERTPRFNSNEPENGRAVFRITNTGPAVAQMVSLEAEGQYGTTTQLPPEALDPSPLPCDISPKQSVDQRFIVLGGAETKYRVSAKWTDGTGSHESHFQLSL